MKTELKEITVEMINEELVTTLNGNFKALDATIQTMGTQILNRLDTVQKEIKGVKGEIKGVKGEINGVKNDISFILLGMDALLKHNKIDPKKLLTDSKKK